MICSGYHHQKNSAWVTVLYTGVVYHTLTDGVEIIIINQCEVYGTFSGDNFIFESSYMIQNKFSQYLTG